MNKILRNVGFYALIILLVLELVLQYDTWVRQVALACTNIAAIASLLVLGRYLRKRGAELPWVVVWASALGVWFDGMGNFLKLYAQIPWWDKLAHAVGSAAVALALLALFKHLRSRQVVMMSNVMLGMVVVSVTAALSVLYEISEYIGDQLFATVRVTDLYDSPDDLLWNLVASSLVVIIGLLVSRKFAPTEHPR